MFGTDGVRGDTRTEFDTTAARMLGRVGAEVLGGDSFAVGRDTRESGPVLVEAFLRGVVDAGSTPIDLGVLPTPGVARWCTHRQVPGAVVSASHNPWHDNGIKFLADDGFKLDNRTQTEIEQRLVELSNRQQEGLFDVRETLSVELLQHDAAGRHYLSAVMDSLNGRDLDGLRVVVDCANGAASELAAQCLNRLGVEVEEIHTHPDGRNINKRCGCLHPESLQAAVVACEADAGVAFDGDADRVLAVDHSGSLIDGDQILAICALDHHRRGLLDGGGVVVTVMANLGLRRAMIAHGIAVAETPVGDRHVVDALDEYGFVLGGEQSGHLIFRNLATTGDGLLTAVQLFDVMVRSQQSLYDLAKAAMKRLPQVLLNVPIPQSISLSDDVYKASLDRLTAETSARLGDSGRALIRLSGTEPVVRVMVEADSEPVALTEAEKTVDKITAMFQWL